MKILQIGSLFYAVIIESDLSSRIISKGYSTREMAETMTRYIEIGS